jgi:hypothetical protein
MNCENLINFKAEILCWGVRTSKTADEIYKKQHPGKDNRTGNAGLHLILDNKLVINAITGDKFCEKSPYKIEEDGIYKDDKKIVDYKIINPPQWYETCGDTFLQEGKNTLITAIWNDCCYFHRNEQCKYCELGYGDNKGFKKVEDIVGTIQMALKESSNIFVHLTGGNTYTPDHGGLNYLKYVKAIREINKEVPISLEMAPPDDVLIVKQLVEAGVDGFSINIEVWNDERRKEICPGKSKITKEKYFAAWKKGVELLGKFKVSSMIIFGLDTMESIKEAIVELVKIGVKPTTIPFRPFEKSQLCDWKVPDPKEYIEITKFLAEKLKEYGAKDSDFVGCEHCGACTIEADYMNC